MTILAQIGNNSINKCVDKNAADHDLDPGFLNSFQGNTCQDFDEFPEQVGN